MGAACQLFPGTSRERDRPQTPARRAPCPNSRMGPAPTRIVGPGEGGQVRGSRGLPRLLPPLPPRRRRRGSRQPWRALSGSGRRGGVVSAPVPARGTRTHPGSPPAGEAAEPPRGPARAEASPRPPSRQGERPPLAFGAQKGCGAVARGKAGPWCWGGRCRSAICCQLTVCPRAGRFLLPNPERSKGGRRGGRGRERCGARG